MKKLKNIKPIDINKIKVNSQFTLITNYKNLKSKNHITKKNWGYYLTDSCNHTLKKNGFKTALVLSKFSDKNKIFIKIVHKNKIKLFNKYLKENKSCVLTWFDKWEI